jgi:hypothetical protein
MATATLSKEMLEAHPWPAQIDRDVLVRCIDECSACETSCTACADASLAEGDVADMRKCIRLCLDCADVCTATLRVVSRQTDYDANVTRPQLQACVAACRSCGDECERHAEMHEHCRICAEACRRCKQACDQLLAAMQ